MHPLQKATAVTSLAKDSFLSENDSGTAHSSIPAMELPKDLQLAMADKATKSEYTDRKGKPIASRDTFNIILGGSDQLLKYLGVSKWGGYMIDMEMYIDVRKITHHPTGYVKHFYDGGYLKTQGKPSFRHPINTFLLSVKCSIQEGKKFSLEANSSWPRGFAQVVIEYGTGYHTSACFEYRTEGARVSTSKLY